MGVDKSIHEFAELLYKIQKSDRDNNIAISGFTGEGKSCFLTKVLKAYGHVSGVPWSYNLMTWSRKELLEWIDGKKDGKIIDGLIKGQLPEYSAIALDELFLLFYRRNWFDEGQIDAIATLNMCRDRHLLIGGNVPNFWDLDGAFTSRIRFYAYIPWRGTAWVFEQDNNPFTTDKWNRNLNMKILRLNHNQPYKCPNFLCEIHFGDWSPEEKEEYYSIRNSKRLTAIDENTSDKKERYSSIKTQRDNLIRLVYNNDDNLIKILGEKEYKKLGFSKLQNGDIAELLGISKEAVRLIRIQAR